MSFKVSTFLNVGGGTYKFTFLLVLWNDYKDSVRDEMNRQAEAFGEDLGLEGALVQPYPQRMHDTAQEVLNKKWPPKIGTRMSDDADPLLLIVNRDFASFDPRQDPYAIIWLSDYHSKPESIRPMLQQLARRTRRGDDVIVYLRDIAERASEAEHRQKAAGVARRAARLASYIEIKPNIFGVSVDVSAILKDIASQRDS